MCRESLTESDVVRCNCRLRSEVEFEVDKKVWKIIPKLVIFGASNNELYEKEIRMMEARDNKGKCLREKTNLVVQ